MDIFTFPNHLTIFQYEIVSYLARPFSNEYKTFLQMDTRIHSTNYSSKRFLHMIRLHRCFSNMNKSRFHRYYIQKICTY